MDQDGARIPAWKKLGLKLANGGQSGRQATDSNDHQGDGHQPVKPTSTATSNGDDIHHTVSPTENGKTARLAKRKSDVPAEGDGQALKKSKKSKKSQEKELSDANAVDDDVMALTKEENAEIVPALNADTPSDQSQPKGDPNYRKKKGPKVKSAPRPDTSSQQEAIKVQPQHGAPEDAYLKPGSQTAHRHSRTPSLSPGQADLPNYEGSLLASTETDYPASQPITTPRRPKKTALHSSPPHTDRRKSVTFTPDTKTEDGTSAGNLFKKWVLEQKGAGVGADFTEAEISQFVPPPKVHPANSVPAPQPAPAKEDSMCTAAERKAEKAEKRRKRQKEDVDSTSNATLDTATLPNTAVKGKKKDHSLYLSYLSQYHKDRANWKFNKAKQNDVLDNALNIFRIPDTYSEALFDYVKGLKGAGIIERLRGKCSTALKDIDESMDDPKEREIAREEALQERLAQEKKRRRADADIEDLAQHPNPDGYIRRLKRRRVETLIRALNMAVPIQVVSQTPTSDAIVPATTQKLARKRKSRTEISSDESSSESSSSSEDESSSSESESDSESDSEQSSDGSGSDSESSRDAESDSGDSSEGRQGTSSDSD